MNFLPKYKAPPPQYKAPPGSRNFDRNIKLGGFIFEGGYHSSHSRPQSRTIGRRVEKSPPTGVVGRRVKLERKQVSPHPPPSEPGGGLLVPPCSIWWGNDEKSVFFEGRSAMGKKLAPPWKINCGKKYFKRMFLTAAHKILAWFRQR